jgi:hypothetical protein
MRITTLSLALVASAGLLACGNGDSNPEADTIAVPAAAVDTTLPATDSTGAAVEAGTPGAGTTESGRSAATGVDTPITRKLNEEQQKPRQP